jgi:shikimate 5-dehydrogenase
VDAIRLCGLVVDDAHQSEIMTALHDQEDAVKLAGACDFVAIAEQRWKGFALLPRALRAALEAAFKSRHPDAPPLEGKAFTLVGTSPLARGIASDLRRKGVAVTVAEGNNDRAKRFAEEVGVRFIPNGQVYSAQSDALILVADQLAKEPGVPAMVVPPSVARAGMAIADLSYLPYTTKLVDEARVRDGLPIAASEVVVRTALLILRSLTGKTLKPSDLAAPLAEIAEDLEEIRSPVAG